MKVYGPVWFNVVVFNTDYGSSEPLKTLVMLCCYVKIQYSCAEGSKHLWRMIKFSRYLLPYLRAIVDKVIQRNRYYGHSENIPLCMLSDERPCILAARKETASNSTTTLRDG